MTYRRLVTMGTRTTRSGGRRLLAAALLSGMAMVALSSHNVSALTLQECHERGGMVDGRGNCSYTAKDGRIVIEPVVGARVQSGATPAPTGQGTPKPVTPAVKTPPPIQVKKPDLVPIPRPGGVGREGFCFKDPSGKLVVNMKNQGGIAIQAATIRATVDFPGVGSRFTYISTKGIPAGGTVSFPGIEIPAGVIKPGDLNFSISVDSSSEIDESNEMNNRVDGTCIG
ncbi:MAG: hypothetical protein HYY11_03480 [Candidatus Methylomirabilis oxyfera]|nr:hypothetical protein [Candidatus Methylomirabilis oxyfera]